MDEEEKVIDAYVPQEDEKCWLEVKEEPWVRWKQCCCVCKYHLADYEHCAVNKKLRDEKDTCICNILKGYICASPLEKGRAHSNWPRHSCGCEMFERREDA